MIFQSLSTQQDRMSQRLSRLLLTVLMAAPVCLAQTPSVTGLSPSSISAGSGAFTLTVFGSNFQTGAAVSWNATNLQTTIQGSAQLSAVVTPGLLTTPGF